MRRIALLAAWMVAFIIVIGGAPRAEAQTVRGKIERKTAYGIYPATSVEVTLSARNRGRSSPAYTDNQGFYYLHNIPPGKYVLEIWVGQTPVTRQIRVLNRPYTDIPPIRVR